MNFSFNIGSKISMSNGSMEIKNGNQIIKMGPNGMEIKNGRNSNITMSGNGIRVINMGNNGMNMKISSTNGISINGNPINNNFRGYNQTFNYNFSSNPDDDYPEYESDYEDLDEAANIYDEENTVEDEEEEEEEKEEPIEEEDEESEEIVDRGLTIAEIQCLPTRRFKMEINNKKSNKDSASCMCSICKCDYMNLEKIRTLPCFHSFHMECIDPWLAIKNFCPLCKNKVAERR